MLTKQSPTKEGEILYVIHILEIFGNTLLNWFSMNRGFHKYSATENLRKASKLFLLLQNNIGLESIH